MFNIKSSENESCRLNETIERLNELEKLALTPNEKGDVNLSLAVKIEELKAKFFQLKSEQAKETNCTLNVVVQNKRQKKLVDEI